MKIKTTICVAILLLASSAASADSLSTGKSLYAAKGCIGCHGPGGKPMVAEYPTLKGKDAAFVKKSLSDFKSGARKNPTMNAMAVPLSAAEIEYLAVYIESL